MGRTLPTVCDHGLVVDWGDFDPGPDDWGDRFVGCAECEAVVDHAEGALQEVYRLRAAVALHRQVRVEGGADCAECRKPWPCLTAHTAVERAA